MAATKSDRRPLWIRASSRVAALFGVRFYNMLYGERSLLETLEHVEPSSDLMIREATAGDLELLSSVLDPEQAESCRTAADQQSRCLVALHGQEIAGYSWLNTRDVFLLSWRVQRLPPEGGYTYNSFVRPEFRGQKIFQCLTEAVYSQLEQEGFQFCCNLVDKDNAPSIAARGRLGAQFHAAPILKLPGLDPLPLRRLPFGSTSGDAHAARQGTSPSR